VADPGKVETLDPVVRLVLVDDDDDFREAAAIELGHLGFEVASLADGVSLFRFFEQGKSADIIILDWKLPTYDGIDVLPQLRRHGIQVPVVS
jgi:two-component system response regulator ChvI